MKTTYKGCAFLIVMLLALMVGTIFLVLRDNGIGNQQIVFADGTSMRLLNISVGTNHVNGPPWLKVVSKLPRPLEEFISEKLSRGKPSMIRNTTRSNLVLWVEYSGAPGRPSQSRRVALRASGGLLSGDTEYLSFWIPQGSTSRVDSIAFDAWPRRAEELDCVILEQGEGYTFKEAGSFRFQNPSVVQTSGWQPEPLPVTRSVGDLQVTLEDFVSGLGNSTRHESTSDGIRIVIGSQEFGREPGALAVLSFNPLGGSNADWVAYNADLWDAAGNKLNATSRSAVDRHLNFRPILWPDEPAWKLRLHLKRKAGFESDELLVFTNIPVPEIGATNVNVHTNILKGIEVALTSFVRRPDLTNNSWSSDDLSILQFDHSELDETNQLDLVEIVVHPAGTNLTTSGASWSDDYHKFNLKSIPNEATHLDVTLSLQKARFVEFLVAPNWTTNEYVVKETGIEAGTSKD